MGTEPGSLCLVAVELDYVVKNGGIGTANWTLAHLLARHGWQVHILYVCPVPDHDRIVDVRRRLAASGIGFTHIDELPTPPILRVPDRRDLFHLNLSERVRHALEELQGRHHFDLIEFAESIGTGFRTMQAKRASGAFAKVGLLVKLHSMMQWLREGNRSWLTRGDELLVDYLERQAFADADFQVSPSSHLFDYARRIGWTVRDDAAVVPYALPEKVAGVPSLATPSELVFFGRLEVRMGLDLFLTALHSLDPALSVTFLGRDTLLDDGKLATQYIRQRLRKRPATILTQCDRDQALRYLMSGPRLAVLPSLMENYANAVLECLVHGIPFLASAVGGTPEIVPPELHVPLLFQPTAEDLARCVTAYRSATGQQRETWRRRLQELRDVDRHNQLVLNRYDQFLDQARAGRTGLQARPHERTDQPIRTDLQVCPTSQGLVSIVLSEADASPTLLRALSEQTYRDLEILILDDGAMAERKLHDPRCRTVFSPDEAKGEFLLPLDGQTLPRPSAVERMVAALQRNPNWSALVGYALSIRGVSDIAKGKFSGIERPTGGPVILGSISNVYGEAPALFRRSDLAGASESRSVGNWLACVRLACAGRVIGVLPEQLFYQLPAQRAPDDYVAQMRIIEEYARCSTLPGDERFALWTALVSFHQQRTDCLKELFTDNLPLRYKLVDRLNAAVKRAPWLHAVGRGWLQAALWLGKRMSKLTRSLSGRRVTPLS